MKSSLGARVLLAFGFLAAALAYSGWWASRIAFDPSATRSAAKEILSTERVQHTLGDEIATRVDEELRKSNTDPQIRAAVGQALRDPRVEQAFANAVGDVHAALLSNSPTGVTIDARALTSALHDALKKQNPKLAQQLQQQAPVQVQIGGNKMPNLSGARNYARTAEILGSLFALLFIALSLFLDRSRRAWSRIGRRIAYLATGPIVLFVGVPMFVGGDKGSTGEVVAAALRSYRSRVLPSAIALIVTGVVVVLAAWIVPKLRPARAPEPTWQPAPPTDAMPVMTAPSLGTMPTAAVALVAPAQQLAQPQQDLFS